MNDIDKLPISDRALRLKPSQIREVAEAGMGMDDIIPLWFGETPWQTSHLAVDAAVDALKSGDHFYQPNSGKPQLRQQICHYQQQLYGQEFNQSRITVTASGMQGLALVAQAITTPNDRIVSILPSWPNVLEAFKISGAEVICQNLQVKDGKWALDLDQLISLLTPNTKAVVLNSPNNPTGWTMPEADMRILFDHCRKYGIWLLADDVYARLYRHGHCAPSFLQWATDEDRFISINSFSKAWSMTGWRLGWICAPSALENTFAMLSEFSIAGPAGFVQQAGIKMLQAGEGEVKLLNQRLKAGYQIASEMLQQIDGVEFIQPDGAFYCFFKVKAMTDSLQTAKNLLDIAKVGVAPGAAFGTAGEGYLRICYAQPTDILQPALERLAAGLNQAKV